MQLRFICLLGIFSAQVASAASSGVAGTWRGESVCVTENPACHDERVVYYIKDVPDRTDLVSVRADKIVDEKPITMGTARWEYDRLKNTLEWRTPRQIWFL